MIQQPFGLFLDEKFWRVDKSIVHETPNPNGSIECIINWPGEILGPEWQGYGLTFHGVRLPWTDLSVYKIEIRKHDESTWLDLHWVPTVNVWNYAIRIEQTKPSIADWKRHQATALNLYRLFLQTEERRIGRPSEQHWRDEHAAELLRHYKRGSFSWKQIFDQYKQEKELYVSNRTLEKWVHDYRQRIGDL